MLKINEGDYAYASARIRAMEIKLLDQSRFDRMLDAPTAEEAYKVLTEAEYGMGGSSSESVYSFEALLGDEMRKCYSVLIEMAPQPEIVNAFQRRYDYFNVKVLLKAEFLGQSAPPILLETGVIDADKMMQIIRDRDYKEIDPLMQQAIEEVYDVFSRTQDPQIVDLILDKASYHQFVTDLSKISSPFLNKLAEIIIDMTNIKMFIRARSINKAWDFINKLLLEGGCISKKVYFDCSDKPIDTFAGEIRLSPYGDAVGNGLELYKKKNNISGLERLLDDYLMNYIRGAKLVLMGIEPLIAYLFAKETEIKNVRVIMTGKINKLPVDLIRERLRLSYV